MMTLIFGEVQYNIALKTIFSEFNSYWVPHTSGLVPQLNCWDLASADDVILLYILNRDICI